MSLLNNLLRCFCHAPRILGQWLVPTPRPRLIMTLLVKNEADIIAQNLHYHRAVGVDGFIVTDNGSTDGTREILQSYHERGWILHIIDEPTMAYEQKRWVDHMIRLAADCYGADWIINADADEFWYAPTHSLKATLASVRHSHVRCYVQNFRPLEGLPLTAWNEAVLEVPQPKQHGLSPYSIYARAMRKVAHRAVGYLRISMGNHKVTMLPSYGGQSDIVVFHFNIRGREHFLRKVEQGGRAITRLRQQRGGRHWRYFYKLLLAGQIENEYHRVVGTHHIETLREAGYIVTDNRLRDFFIAHPECIVR
ncbi:MAG: glycosyltransferase family 2 protein [Bacteroidales bacterium]|nr:glycosyltransferase family 2 protein [Bacteroidales bacterium]